MRRLGLEFCWYFCVEFGGKLWFDLKEGTGQRMVLPFVPRARAVASTIANIVMDFQGRRAVKAPNVQMHEEFAQQA